MEINNQKAIAINDIKNQVATLSIEIAEKILRHSESLGGISRFTFQMDNASLSQTMLLKSIELIGTKVKPIVNKQLFAK